MEDPALERGEISRDDSLAALQHAASVDDPIGRSSDSRYLWGPDGVQGLEARASAPEAAVHRIPGDAEDPHQQARVAAVAPEHVKNGEKHLLGNVLGLSRIPQALERETIDARKVGLVQQIERLLVAAQDLLDQLRIARPRLILPAHLSLPACAGGEDRGGGNRSESLGRKAQHRGRAKGRVPWKRLDASVGRGPGIRTPWLPGLDSSYSAGWALQKWGLTSRAGSEQALCQSAAVTRFDTRSY